MKKILIALAAIVLGGAVTAQSLTEEQQRQWRQFKHQRDISQQVQFDKHPVAPAAKGQAAGLAKGLPEDRVWFPGEWEEVKAVVVTPYYSYYPDTNLGSGTFIADPLVSGMADYYKYSRTQGYIDINKHGPYYAVMDTASTFGMAFFYLMDGIQQGHAEAWVRVEQPDDTARVLRTLIRKNLRHDSVRFVVGPGNSFWYRDCGPICFYHGEQDSVAMMDFEYYAGRALDDSLPTLIYQQMGIPNYITTLEWEGGNCLVDGAGFLFTSEAAYTTNTNNYGQLTWNGRDYSSINYTSKTALSRPQIKAAFQSLIGQRETHLLPAYQYDGGTGHVDLYADMCEENGFVFSVMPGRYSSWTDYRTGVKNMDSLCSYTSLFDRPYYRTTIPFPCTDNGGAFSSQSVYNSSYTRTYSNHTFVNDLILQPCFSAVVNGQPSAAWDRAKVDSLKAAYPGYTIYPIDVREFDGSGGAIHCVTKQIPADSPVRILHKSIVGSADAMRGHDIPVSAVITNRSGIAHAECVYRVDGGSWDTLSLSANGNKFSSLIPTAGINERRLDTSYVPQTRIDSTLVDSAYTYDTVSWTDTVVAVRDTMVRFEYYLSATSNEGKTIRKPMTAHQGGYYSFWFDGQLAELDSLQYDWSTAPRPATDITFLFDAQRTVLDTTAVRGEGDDTTTVAVGEVCGGMSFGQFYPNPAQGEAHIDINLGNGASCLVDIIDQQGRTVHTAQLQSAGTIRFSIRADKLAPGLYTVRFRGNGQQAVRRLVVSR